MAVAALRAWVASVTVPGRDPFLELEPPLQEGGQGQRLDLVQFPPVIGRRPNHRRDSVTQNVLEESVS